MASSSSYRKRLMCKPWSSRAESVAVETKLQRATPMCDRAQWLLWDDPSSPAKPARHRSASWYAGRSGRIRAASRKNTAARAHGPAFLDEETKRDGFVSAEEALAALRRAGGGPPGWRDRQESENLSPMLPEGGLWSSATRLAPYVMRQVVRLTFVVFSTIQARPAS